MTSVIVPVYNGGAVLERTVPAVLALAAVDEWVYVDDGSTDDSAARLDALLANQQNARRVPLETNRGRSAARNAGTEAADGDVLVFLDADVEPSPEAALRLGEALERPGAVAAVARVRSVLDRPDDPYQRYLAAHPRGAVQTEGAIGWRYFLSGACALRRATLQEAGGFDASIAYGEDFELACRLSRSRPDGLRLAGTAVAVHEVGTLGSAMANMEAFGRSLARMRDRCPEAMRIAEIPEWGASLAALPIHPPARLVHRLVRTLPSVLQPVGVRYALGLALLRGYGRA